VKNKGNLGEAEQKGQLFQNQLDGVLTCSKSKALSSSLTDQPSAMDFNNKISISIKITGFIVSL